MSTAPLTAAEKRAADKTHVACTRSAEERRQILRELLGSDVLVSKLSLCADQISKTPWEVYAELGLVAVIDYTRRVQLAEVACDLRKQGYSVPQIARRLLVRDAEIRAVLGEYSRDEATSESNDFHRTKVGDEQKIKILRLFHVEGMTVEQIAKRNSLGATTIRRVLSENKPYGKTRPNRG